MCDFLVYYISVFVSSEASHFPEFAVELFTETESTTTYFVTLGNEESQTKNGITKSWNLDSMLRKLKLTRTNSHTLDFYLAAKVKYFYAVWTPLKLDAVDDCKLTARRGLPVQDATPSAWYADLTLNVTFNYKLHEYVDEKNYDPVSHLQTLYVEQKDFQQLPERFFSRVKFSEYKLGDKKTVNEAADYDEPDDTENMGQHKASTSHSITISPSSRSIVAADGQPVQPVSLVVLIVVTCIIFLLIVMLWIILNFFWIRVTERVIDVLHAKDWKKCVAEERDEN
ncbi:hypothetical protein PHET_08491 [Paragonimus heterotremus]|uniref:Uncharacterized protein n=1 Tax=Paragonimus heterotremus TaxID=100268 RepID=A0A8J4TDZ3_9TREM|nr:hypothetical protein PHET_08491 [Paragonimus heterotremus]